MKDKERTFRGSSSRSSLPSLQWLRIPRGLQADMTISYVWVTVGAVLVLETLALAINGLANDIAPGAGPWQFTGRLAGGVLVSLLIAAPVGGLFGLITTRGLVRRLHSLVRASTRF